MIILGRLGARPERALLLAAILLIPGFLLVSTARAGSGGPDAYGYTWADSQPPERLVTYNWIDDGITKGTPLSISDDSCSDPLDIGFSFGFYGVQYASVQVCANGFLAFGLPGGFPYPAEGGTDDYAAPLCTDLDPEIGGQIYAWEDNASTPRRFVATWNAVPLYGDPAFPETFQVSLNETAAGDSLILFQYKTITSDIDHIPGPGSGCGSSDTTSHMTGISNLTNTPSLYYPNPLGNSLAVVFIPPAAGLPPDNLQVTGTNLAPPTVELGQSSATMAALNLVTATGFVDVLAIRVDLTGAYTSPVPVALARLWNDANGNGSFDAGQDLPIANTSFSGNPLRADFTINPSLRVTPSVPRLLFVTYEIAANATVNEWIGAAVVDSTYVTVASSDTVSGVNLPLNTYGPGVRTQIRRGIDTVSVTDPRPMNPANVTQWQPDVPFLNFTVAVSTVATVIANVTVHLTGVPPLASDVRLVKAFLDANRNGQVDPAADRLLGTGRVMAGTLNATIPLNLSVVAGNPRTVLLLLDIAGAAVVNDNVSLLMADSTYVRLAPATGDVMSSAGFPIATPASTVQNGTRPVLRSSWARIAPSPDGQLSPQEYFLSVQNAALLSEVAGNTRGGYAIVENNDTFLYVAYDALDDRTPSSGDGASIAFDTDANDTVTNGADDEFSVGGPPGGPIHALYDGSANGWTVEDSCDENFTPQHAGLRCALGFGSSDLDVLQHRVYEFRVPLALLGVPSPIPVNYSMGFAAVSQGLPGLLDAATAPGTATWPFLFPAQPPLEEYARLILTSAPPPNRPPSLTWTDEPGFVGRGANPVTGTDLDTYEFRVNYTDLDGDPPAFGFPQLHVLDGATEIPGSPFRLTARNPTDTEVRDGKIYVTTIAMPACPRTYTYFFGAIDSGGASNSTATESGPTVTCAPRPPRLTAGFVTPVVGNAVRTRFTYNVTYSDNEGEIPTWVNVIVNKSGLFQSALALTFAGWVGPNRNYTEGAYFNATTNLTGKGNDYTYAFNASDGMFITFTSTANGPTVVEPSDRVNVQLFDAAPLVVDQGATNVTMFTAYVSMTEGSARLTSFRIERAGASVDSDVARVELWWVVDVNRSQLLRSEVLAQGRVTFSGFSLLVAPTSSVLLRAAMDVSPTATADDRIGFRVLDASYVAVESPDYVVLAAAFQTPTPPLVNAPPFVSAVLVAGQRAGSPEILHLTNATPTFSWTFADLNSGTIQLGFDASVYGPTGPALWSHNEASASASVLYGGPALSGGTNYSIVISVTDGRLWTQSAAVDFRLDTPPSAPILLSPSSGNRSVQKGAVRLDWDASADADRDPLRFFYELSTSADFSIPVERGNTSDNHTFVNVPNAGTTYFWRVRASDGYIFSPWSAAFNFTTLATSGSIRGRVVRADGGPVRGALVHLYGGGGAPVDQKFTDTDGTFRFDNLAFGDYSLQVEADGFEHLSVPRQSLTASNADLNLGDLVLVVVGPLSILLNNLWLVALLAAIIVAVGIAIGLRRRRAEGPPAKAAPRDRAASRGKAISPPEAGEPTEGTERVEEAPVSTLAASTTRTPPPVAGTATSYECPECGARVAAEATRCPRCGVEFAVEEEPAAPPEAAPLVPPISEIEPAREAPSASEPDAVPDAQPSPPGEKAPAKADEEGRVFCTECGQPLDPDASFCSECGAWRQT